MVNETQSTELQEYEIQDFIDGLVATGAFDAYVYKFKQGGRWIEALSARGVEHIAKDRRISIIDYTFTPTDDPVLGYGVLCVAMAKISIKHPAKTETLPDGTQIVTEAYAEELTAPGSNFTPAHDAKGKVNPFYHQTALVKAMRNARLQFIEVASQQHAIQELLKLQNAQAAPIPANATQRQQSAPKAQAEQPKTATEKAMKACFDVFNKKEDDLLEKGVAKKDFWDALGKILGVKSRDDMTIVQWNQVRTALEAKPYGKIVQDVIDTLKAPKATEKTTDPDKEGDQPF